MTPLEDLGFDSACCGNLEVGIVGCGKELTKAVVLFVPYRILLVKTDNVNTRAQTKRVCATLYRARVSSELGHSSELGSEIEIVFDWED